MKKLRFLIGILFCAIIVLGSTTYSSFADETGEKSSTTYSPSANETEAKSRVRLIIESYEVTDGLVMPGNEVKVRLTVKNTSSSLVAQNVVISTVNNQGIAFPVEGKSNQTYLGSMEAGETRDVVIPLRISEQVKNEENLILVFYLTFSDFYSIEVSNEAYVSIPLKEECSPSIRKLGVEDYCYAAQNSVLSSEIANSGVVTAEDVTLHVVFADNQEVVYPIGTLESGLTKFFDHTVCIPQAGEQLLKAYLTYKDEEGNVFITETSEYAVRVLEGSANGAALQGDDTGEANKEFWIRNLVLIVVAFLIILVFHKRDTRKINSRKEVGDGK